MLAAHVSLYVVALTWPIALPSQVVDSSAAGASPSGGFDFSLAARDAALADGLAPAGAASAGGSKKLKTKKTGTTIAGVVFEVRPKNGEGLREAARAAPGCCEHARGHLYARAWCAAVAPHALRHTRGGGIHVGRLGNTRTARAAQDDRAAFVHEVPPGVAQPYFQRADLRVAVAPSPTAGVAARARAMTRAHRRV